MEVDGRDRRAAPSGRPAGQRGDPPPRGERPAGSRGKGAREGRARSPGHGHGDAGGRPRRAPVGGGAEHGMVVAEGGRLPPVPLQVAAGARRGASGHSLSRTAFCLLYPSRMGGPWPGPWRPHPPGTRGGSPRERASRGRHPPRARRRLLGPRRPQLQDSSRTFARVLRHRRRARGALFRARRTAPWAARAGPRS